MENEDLLNENDFIKEPKTIELKHFMKFFLIGMVFHGFRILFNYSFSYLNEQFNYVLNYHRIIFAFQIFLNDILPILVSVFFFQFFKNREKLKTHQKFLLNFMFFLGVFFSIVLFITYKRSNNSSNIRIESMINYILKTSLIINLALSIISFIIVIIIDKIQKRKTITT